MLFRRKKNKRKVLSLNDRDLIKNFAVEHLQTGYTHGEVVNLKKVLNKRGLSCSEEKVLQLIKNEINLQREIDTQRKENAKREEQEMKEKRRQFRENRKQILKGGKKITPGTGGKRKEKNCSVEKEDLIRNFAVNHLEKAYTPQEVNELKEILNKKGIPYSDEELRELIKVQKEKQKRVQRRKENLTRKFAVKNHLETRYTSLEVSELKEILNENGISCSEKETTGLIKKWQDKEIEKQELAAKRKQAAFQRKKERAEEAKRKENERIEREKEELMQRKKEIERKRDELAIQKRKERIERKKRVELLKKERRERAKKKEREIKEKTQELISSGNYILVNKFAKKYGLNYDYSSEKSPTYSLEKKIYKLKRLMEVKGTNLSQSQLREIINREIKRQEYEAFASKILYNQPDDIKGYVKNLVDIYGENYSQCKDLFLTLLKENKIVFNENNLNTLIQSTIEQKELELLENELLDFDSYNTEIINSLDSLTGYEFEDFLKGLFNKMGFTAEATKLSGDQGADLIIEKFGKKIAVQAKRYNGKVSNTAIQEVTASIAYYGANSGMVVTTGEFTVSAIELAMSNNIKLIGRQKLEELIQKYY